MNVINWFKRQIAGIIISTGNVEGSALGQGNENLLGIDGKVQHNRQDSLSDALLKGKLTQEVKELRWRMYKVLSTSEGIRLTGEFDVDGNPIIVKYDYNVIPNNIVGEPSDDYKIDMVFDNKASTVSIVDTFTAISEGYSMDSLKPNSMIQINRVYPPKFLIENYTKKLFIKDCDFCGTKLLEFFISKYPNELDKKTNLLVSEIKRAMVNPRISDMLDMESVEFVTNKTLGSRDLLHYKYDDIVFDKIVEYDGDYVIKFKAKLSIDGFDLIKEYENDEVESLYSNNAKRENDLMK